MGVSLYTVRVVLSTLGEVDYGLYNVVGGVVTMFAFLSGTMASASQRFMAYELGRQDHVQLKRTFSMTIIIYLMIGVIVLILAESVGLWFLQTKMTIPENRRDAALWVYQFSILSFMMTMFTIPYNAAIIARERMKVYALVSIFEAGLKLLVVYLLVAFSYDKLKLYSVLMFIVTSIITLIYRTYCQRKFEECRFEFYWDKVMFKKIVGFSGWNVIGNLALVLREQGLNVLLNMFFNPAVNAARGISFQATSVINSFVTNFQTALNPYITKKYASGNYTEYLTAINQGARFSYYLMFFLSLPVLLKTEYILTLWLTRIPDYTVVFVRLIIVISLIDTFYRTLVIGIMATGKIKYLQLLVGGLNLLLLPISFLFLQRGFSPQVVFYVGIAIGVLGIIPRVIILKQIVPAFSVGGYFRDVILSIFLVTVISIIGPLFFTSFYGDDGVMGFALVTSMSILSVFLTVYFIGLKKIERESLNKTINDLIIKFFK